jgi:DNA polymerase I-like protein with 3'-5' exonuclease and polymerase domains
MSYLVLDYETNILRYKKRKASPFHPDNNALIVINKEFKKDVEVRFLPAYYRDFSTDPKQFTIGIKPGTTLLVGHNLKFDLLYSWHLDELQDFLKRGGRIWDTQYAEYLLEGQSLESQMCSLDSIVEKYGGALKPDVVKQHWDQGIDTPDIQEDILQEYSEGDGVNTEKVFLGQLKRAMKQHPNFMEMLKLRMDGLLATTEMEYNGLCLDAEKGETQRQELQERLDKLDADLLQYIPELPPELEFNWGSRFHKSFLIFGGYAKYQRWTQHTDPETLEPLYANKTEKWPLFDGQPIVPDAGCELGADQLYYRRREDDGCLQAQDTYKSGKNKGTGKFKNVTVPDYDKPKGSKQDYSFKFPGYTHGAEKWKAAGEDAKGGPVYSTSSDVIEALGNRNVPFLQLLAERQKIDKDLGTYYWKEDKNGDRKGMLTLISEFDGRIHHSLNHTNTVTTRLSSSDPNCQNLSRGDKSTVKGLFVSRFGEDGEMGEIDYSQLEVIVQGWLSGDKQLREDILNGIDFHCKRLAQKLGEDYAVVKQKAKDEEHPDYPVYSVMRTGVKGFSFQRAYGAGAAAIAEATGLGIEEVEELIEAERQLYPGIESFNEDVSKLVHKSRRESDDVLYTKAGIAKVGVGSWFAPTGTKYTFRESEAPEFLQKRGQRTSFSPPDLKNYPIQGTGGEVVQMVLGKLFRLFLSNGRYGGKAYLVNTVHDCVWFDYKKEVRDKVLNDAIRVMQAIPLFLQKHFDIDCGVVFRVDAEYGDNMLSLHHFNSKHYIK